MSTYDLRHQLSNLHPDLLSFTRRFTKDRDESLDLVQDTILKALSYSDQFRENRNLLGWLFIIMRNTFINQYRNKKRTAALRDTTKNLFFLHTEDIHTFSRPQSTVEYNELWNHINALPEELGIPFKMHVTGYKYQEIAEQLNIPLGTVKNRIFHARKEVQKKLEGY